MKLSKGLIMFIDKKSANGNLACSLLHHFRLFA